MKKTTTIIISDKIHKIGKKKSKDKDRGNFSAYVERLIIQDNEKI